MAKAASRRGMPSTNMAPGRKNLSSRANYGKIRQRVNRIRGQRGYKDSVARGVVAGGRRRSVKLAAKGGKGGVSGS